MSAPEGFQLNPAPEGLHLPPSPPKRLKPEIYQNLSVFKNVDEHAIAVSLRLWFFSIAKKYYVHELSWTYLCFTEC